MSHEAPPRGLAIGDYVLFETLGSGGMASVHLGRGRARAGFARAVAIKRMHPHLASDPEFVSMFLDEARIASRIRHPNVVSTLDLCRSGSDVIIVMDVVVGESLGALIRTSASLREMVPVDVATAIGLDMLAGLHGAHEATDERGVSLGVIHRDVSPENVLVGIDGIARVVDFGIAQAETRTVHTATGAIRGKLAYMAPERIAGQPGDRRLDVYAASVVLWETFACRRLFQGDQAAIVSKITTADVRPLSRIRDDVPPELDAVIAAGMARDVAARHPTAASLADALASIAPRATSAKVGAWVGRLAREALRERQQRIVDIETGSAIFDNAPPRSQLSPRARRRVVGGVGVGLVTGAALFAGWQWLQRPTDRLAAGNEGTDARDALPTATLPPPTESEAREATDTSATSGPATASSVTQAPPVASVAASPPATSQVHSSARPIATTRARPPASTTSGSVGPRDFDIDDF